jgi:hypothetical protein
VLWTLIEHPAYLDNAARFAESDRYPESRWIRRKAIPNRVPRDDSAACVELADAIRGCFRPEGRGYWCTVEPLKRDDEIYYFAYPDDHARSEPEYDHGVLSRRTYRPAFEIVFVLSQPRRTLDVCHKGPRDVVQALVRVFGKVILGVELPDEPPDRFVYDLNRFKHRDINFVFDESSGIKEVSVVQLKVTRFGSRRSRITVEADPKDGALAIYEVLPAELRTWNDPVAQSQTNVVRVGLRAEFRPDGRRGRQTRTFSLSYPDSCSLRHDGRDAILRQMLIDSGIEPALPSDEAA